MSETISLLSARSTDEKGVVPASTEAERAHRERKHARLSPELLANARPWQPMLSLDDTEGVERDKAVLVG